MSEKVGGALTLALTLAQVLTGNYFGPSGIPLPIVLTGRQVGVQEGAVIRASNCKIVGAGHTTIHCLTPAGVGVGYAWTLGIANQAVIAPFQTSFGPPVVTSLAVTGQGVAPDDEPWAVPTAGLATVTLSGANFGADPSRIVVSWNGTPVEIVVVRAPHAALSFLSLAGQGVSDVTVSLTIAGQAASDLPPIHFAAPRVIAMRLLRPSEGGGVLDCSVVRVDGRPENGDGTQQAGVVIEGVNFGQGNAVSVTIGSHPCRLLLPANASHVVCETPYCTGEWCKCVLP